MNPGTLAPGTLLHERYRIVRALSSGGFGSVFEAVDTRLDDVSCAVKMMHPEGASREDVVKRFYEEMKFLARLRHEGIPRVTDYFSADSWYLVMDFVDGPNLEQELNDHLQELQDPAWHRKVVVDVIQVLDVLAYLHSQNPPVIHRDIKPANLIRDRATGRIKVVDFGLARPTETITRSAVGTLAYSPIEQIQGHPEPRSDIYALGATLFHLLCGSPPTPLDPEPPVQVNKSVDEALSAIAVTAMAHAPMQRYRSAAAMRDALTAWLNAPRGTPGMVASSEVPTGTLTMPASQALTGPLQRPTDPAPAVATSTTEPTTPMSRTLEIAPERPSNGIVWAMGALALVLVTVVGFLAGHMSWSQPAPTASPIARETKAVVTPTAAATPTPIAHHAPATHKTPKPAAIKLAVATPTPAPTTIVLTLTPAAYPTAAQSTAVPPVSVPAGGVLQPGQGAGAILLGMAGSELRSLNTQGRVNTTGLSFGGTESAITSITAAIPDWRTPEGLHVGSSRNEVVQALPSPDPGSDGVLKYSSRGVEFRLADGRVSMITIYEKRSAMVQQTAAPPQQPQPPPLADGAPGSKWDQHTWPQMNVPPSNLPSNLPWPPPGWKGPGNPPPPEYVPYFPAPGSAPPGGPPSSGGPPQGQGGGPPSNNGWPGQ